MHRLTLILSDLYLPEEAGRDAVIPTALALPHLDWLLRFAQAHRIADWRRWLAADLGRADLATLPAATLAAREILDATQGESAWLATPVRLEARLDHVRMLERGLPRLAPAERAEWCGEFARAFAPYALHDAGPRGFLLTGIAPAEIATVDPARLLDADIAQALPVGAAARELRQLSAEIEMWMHAAPINLARERAGQPRLSSLWLWGGGAIAPAPRAAAPPPAAHSLPKFHGDDPAFAGIARAVSGALPAAVPTRFGAVPELTDRLMVELTPMNGAPNESLSALDVDWFAPARAALSNGTLPVLDIVANDRWFRIVARSGWRFWRRRISWLARLGQPHNQSKA
jgi:hypothetical protein